MDLKDRYNRPALDVDADRGCKWLSPNAQGFLLACIACCLLLWTAKSSQTDHRDLRFELHRSSDLPPSNRSLQWRPCGDGFFCTELAVPFDHLNSSDCRTMTISVTKFLATRKGSKKGSIIFNPGGPGGSGSGSTYRLGPVLDELLEGKYDIVGFDPRGVNNSVPRISCLESFKLRSEIQRVLGSTTPSTNPLAVGIWDSASQLLAEECAFNHGPSVLASVGTAAVSRDLASIVEALKSEGEEHIAYWGFSYGSNLGTVFSAMFPNLVERVILDGIRSPFDAREVFSWVYSSLQSQDDVFDGYFDICDKVGQQRCPLADREKPSKEIVLELLSRLHQRPLPVSSGSVLGLVTFHEYKSFIYETLHQPSEWHRLAEISLDLLAGNGSSFLEATQLRSSGFQAADIGVAVLCADALPAKNYSLRTWIDQIQNMSKISFIAGDLRSLDVLPCRHWRSGPSERWEGSFDGIVLDHAALLIGNTYDPATPIKSARRLQAQMQGNGILLEQRSYGHCSGSTVSQCTLEYIRKYLSDGELPESGKICYLDDLDYGDYFPRPGQASSPVKSPHLRFSELLAKEFRI